MNSIPPDDTPRRASPGKRVDEVMTHENRGPEERRPHLEEATPVSTRSPVGGIHPAAPSAPRGRALGAP